jgi:hypothetical protein
MLAFLRERARVRPPRPAPMIATERGGEVRVEMLEEAIWAIFEIEFADFGCLMSIDELSYFCSGALLLELNQEEERSGMRNKPLVCR